MIWIIIILIILGLIFWKRGKDLEKKIHPLSDDLQDDLQDDSQDDSKYSTCRFLSQYGPDPRISIDEWLQSDCKMYTDNCGDASNTGFVTNIMEQFAPGTTPFERNTVLLELYNEAIINFANTNWDKALCHNVIPCKSGTKCPYNFTCKENSQPNQGSPACF